MDHSPLHVAESLSPTAALAYLTRVPVGRLAFHVAGKPIILPVNHVVDGETIVFATAPGSKLAAARRGGRDVVYEADDLDEHGTGWWVCVRGRLDVVLDVVEAATLDAMGFHPWADKVRRRRWVRLLPTSVTGIHIRLP